MPGRSLGRDLEEPHEGSDPVLAQRQNRNLNPNAMIGHLGVYGSAMAGTKTLRKVERELVALVVSRYNDCHY